VGSVGQTALERSDHAERCGSLVPLATERLQPAGLEPFVLRRLIADTPKHLRAAGPRPNPFLPWDPNLAVQAMGSTHLVLLNKYPVQRGHLLLISQQWQPQAGWLTAADWQAVAALAADTPGLWFFNSAAAAGASQPHRHLQLLPRSPAELLCPLAPMLERQLAGEAPRWPWGYRLDRRRAGGASGETAEDPQRSATELERIYHQHAQALGLGSPHTDAMPRHPYNLLFCADWFMTVRRIREHWAGFSLNALAFGGYLLLTEGSDLPWLEKHGPWRLLEAVAAPER